MNFIDVSLNSEQISFYSLALFAVGVSRLCKLIFVIKIIKLLRLKLTIPLNVPVDQESKLHLHLFDQKAEYFICESVHVFEGSHLLWRKLLRFLLFRLLLLISRNDEWVLCQIFVRLIQNGGLL